MKEKILRYPQTYCSSGLLVLNQLHGSPIVHVGMTAMSSKMCNAGLCLESKRNLPGPVLGHLCVAVSRFQPCPFWALLVGRQAKERAVTLPSLGFTGADPT